MKKHIITLLALTLLPPLLTACEGPQRLTDLGDAADTDTPSESAQENVITLGQLSGGRSKVTLPLALFSGSEDVMSGTTLAISLNGTLRFQNVRAESFYLADDQVVAFYMNLLTSGDQARFVLTFADGSSQTY